MTGNKEMIFFDVIVLFALIDLDLRKKAIRELQECYLDKPLETQNVSKPLYLCAYVFEIQ